LGELFISYAREDAAIAERLGTALQHAGHQVWWDRQLAGGAQFSDAIETALDSSDAVLVLWSEHSIASPWVRDEAAFGRDSNKLVPMGLDGVAPPLGFRQFHTIDISGWANAGDASLPEALQASLGGPAPETRRPKPSLAKQRVSFCKTPDGVTLAYSRAGQGPPLLKAANWLNHLEYEWGNPLWRHWIDELGERHTLIRYDERGNGMSDWHMPDLSFDHFVDDLATVADAAGLDRFDLLGISQGSPVAIAFAVRYPQRVRRMVLINGFATGWRFARDPAFVQTWDALATLARTGWGQDNPAFRQTFTSLFFPDATPQQSAWWNELQKLSTSPANAERLMRMFGEIDVSDLLEKVSVPTLVLHCRDDQLVPFEAGRLMASRIPNAEFVALESRNHLVLESEPAWAKISEEMRTFLDSEAP
jgi:pimeloyl-ACP methyl ester carboxylesterase